MKYLVILLLLISQSGYSQDVAFTSFKDASKFFLRRLQYPQDALDSNKAGIVLVAVKVKGGQIISDNVIYEESPLFTKEVRRVLDKTKKLWKVIDKETMIIIPFEFVVGDNNDFYNYNKLLQLSPVLSLTPAKTTGVIVLEPVRIISINTGYQEMLTIKKSQ